jgi:hypothetical protein
MKIQYRLQLKKLKTVESNWTLNANILKQKSIEVHPPES